MTHDNTAHAAAPSARITTGRHEGGDLYWTPQAGKVPVPGTAAVILGYTAAGQPVILATTSVGWLDDLEAAIRVARAQGIVEAGMAARS